MNRDGNKERRPLEEGSGCAKRCSSCCTTCSTLMRRSMCAAHDGLPNEKPERYILYRTNRN
jgi:hypothetical protein